MCTVQSLHYLKAAGYNDFAQDRKFDFFFFLGVKSDCHEILSGVSIYEYPENEF